MLANRKTDWNWLSHQIYLGPVAVILDTGGSEVHQVILNGKNGHKYLITDPQGQINFGTDSSATIAATQYELNQTDIHLSQLAWWWPRLPHTNRPT
jgi:hypothetical protein